MNTLQLIDAIRSDDVIRAIDIISSTDDIDVVNTFKYKNPSGKQRHLSTYETVPTIAIRKHNDKIVRVMFNKFPTEMMNTKNIIREKFLSDDTYAISENGVNEIIGTFIFSDDMHSDDEIIKRIAWVYTRYPKLIVKLDEDGTLSKSGYKTYVSQVCYNLNDIQQEAMLHLIPVYNDKGEIVPNKVWCLSSEDLKYKSRHNYNPYTGRNWDVYCEEDESCPSSENCANDDVRMNVSFIDYGDHNKIKLSRKATELLQFWKHEVFTLGNVYFKIPYKICREFAQTRFRENSISLHRGMSFRTEDQFNKFLSNIKYNEIVFKTFSSWTPMMNVAKKFSTMFGNYGVVLTCNFGYKDVLVNLERVSGITSSEKEIIILPGRYAIDHIEYMDK